MLGFLFGPTRPIPKTSVSHNLIEREVLQFNDEVVSKYGSTGEAAAEEDDNDVS